MSQPSAEPKHAESFFINVLWNWVAVAANVFVGFYLTRFVIQKLGDKRYGVWALAFSMVEYIILFDLGFRSAVVNFVSRYRVQDDTNGMSEVLSTSLAYFVSLGALAIFVSFSLAGQAYKAFQISPEIRGDFAFLLMLIGLIWAGSVVSGIFQASLEAFQAFKTFNKIAVGTLLARSVASLVVLQMGYGLRALGLCTFGALFAQWILVFIAFRRRLPAIQIGFAFVRSARWKEMFRYGVNSVFANIGTLFLNQGPPLVVGHYLPEAFVGYYSLPSRLLSYLSDVITRIGFVTAPKTAELFALGKRDEIGLFGSRLNRYCFALFLPASVFIGIYGEPLLTLWLGREKAEFVAHCAPLLPIFTLSVALSIAAQFNSSSILFGMAKHGPFAVSVIIEVVLTLAGMALVIGQYGILGAACVSAAFAIVNRGFITPLLVCRQLPYSYVRYMAGIYIRPLLCGLPLLALAYWLRHSVLPGNSIFQLALACALLSFIGLTVSFFVCVDPEHRLMLWNTARQKLGKAPVIPPHKSPVCSA